MKPIFKFLNDNFKRMPPKWQVRVYLIIVGLLAIGFLSQLLMPDVITGRVVMKDSSGGEVHYRGQEMMVDFAGHTLKFRTNEDGIWVIPAPFTSINVRFDLAPFLGLEDQQSWHEITIGMTDFWFRDVVKVVLSDKSPKIAVESRFAAVGSGITNFSRFARDLFTKRAYAGMLQKIPGLPSVGVVAPVGRSPTSWKEHARTEVQKTKSAIQHIISQITGIQPSAITDGFKLQRNPKLNFRKRVQIISKVEKQFGFRIPDEHWLTLRNLDELSTYVLDRTKIYEEYKFKKTLNWYNIQGRIPRKERPVFRR